MLNLLEGYISDLMKISRLPDAIKDEVFKTSSWTFKTSSWTRANLLQLANLDSLDDQLKLLEELKYKKILYIFTSLRKEVEIFAAKLEKFKDANFEDSVIETIELLLDKIIVFIDKIRLKND
jgi:hypothetical protein